MEKNQRFERRKHRRVLFKYENEIQGVFRLPNNKVFITNIMNLGAGGLQFILNRGQSVRLNAGDTLVLETVRGSREVGFLDGLELKVKWVLNLDFFEHAGIGCIFDKITDQTAKEISQYIEFHETQKK